MIFSNQFYFAAMEHEEGAIPELLDALVDKRHRSYMSAVRGINLGTFRARMPKKYRRHVRPVPLVDESIKQLRGGAFLVLHSWKIGFIRKHDNKSNNLVH